jgi:hypothetical protein
MRQSVAWRCANPASAHIMLSRSAQPSLKLTFPRRVHTVGKYPSVNTLSKLVLPHAPSPMMTNFLHETGQFILPADA